MTSGTREFARGAGRARPCSAYFFNYAALTLAPPIPHRASGDDREDWFDGTSKESIRCVSSTCSANVATGNCITCDKGSYKTKSVAFANLCGSCTSGYACQDNVRTACHSGKYTPGGGYATCLVWYVVSRLAAVWCSKLCLMPVPTTVRTHCVALLIMKATCRLFLSKVYSWLCQVGTCRSGLAQLPLSRLQMEFRLQTTLLGRGGYPGSCAC